MNKEVKNIARKIGVDTVGATRALSHAIALQCRSLQTLVEESTELGRPDLGSGNHAKVMAGAITAMVAAHHEQMCGRISLMQLGKDLKIVGYGEDCECFLGKDARVEVTRSDV